MKKFREWLKEGDEGRIVDKMSLINIQQTLQGKSSEWLEIINRFPEMLQKEILDERPNPNHEDIEWMRSWQLSNKQPIAVNMKNLLQSKENLDSIARTPPDVVQDINQKWGLNVIGGRVYDQNPNRYQKYKQFQGNTAKPSVMVNGVIAFGVGRFIAALLRGDKQLMVWNIRGYNEN